LSRLLRSLPSSSPEPSKKRNQRSAAKRTDGLNHERGCERNPWVVAGYLRREKSGASWTCPRRRPSSPSVASASSAAPGQKKGTRRSGASCWAQV
jgi:hypothetical protein